jgi:hypothetical protein
MVWFVRGWKSRRPFLQSMASNDDDDDDDDDFLGKPGTVQISFDTKLGDLQA